MYNSNILSIPDSIRDADTDKTFHAVYLRNIGRVYRLCYLRLGHREDAEDAAQNIFLRYLKSGTCFSSEEHEKSYFLRAACNECSNIRHSFWRTRRVDYDDIPEHISAVSPEEPQDASVLQLLPARYRDVLYLYYYEELSAAAIAKLLSRNESTVRTQLQVGRERLRDALTEKEESK